uniref:Vesicle associated membrane protein 4 n=1 Tax=Myotis myotis TaxID=51298 RepID=A0A7J7SV86_MYOMY|nr:vesicle associated membrane protein 4 [Myotis myotis]
MRNQKTYLKIFIVLNGLFSVSIPDNQHFIMAEIQEGDHLDQDLDLEMIKLSKSLSDNATAFSNRSKQLRRQMWWRGCKIKAIMALVVVILLLVIIILTVVKYRT